MSLAVHGVRGGGFGTAPDRGAAGRVRDEHPVAEQLSGKLCVRSLSAARARAGEFQQRLTELAALDGGRLELFQNLGLRRNGLAVIEHGLAGALGVDRLEHQGLFAFHTGAYLRAGAAARAVERGNRNGEFQARQAVHILRLGALRGFRKLFRGHDDRTDDGVRTYIRAEVALNAVRGVPFGDIHRDPALFIGGGALRHGAVRIILKVADRQLFAAERVDGLQNVVDIIDKLGPVSGGLFNGFGRIRVFPGSRDIHLVDILHAALDGRVVHRDDLLALFAVRLRGGVLHELNRLIRRDNVGDLEEGGLQNRVDASAETELLADLDPVDGVEMDAVFGNVFLHLAGQPFVKLPAGPRAVQKEVAALFQVLHNVVFVHIGRVVAGDEIRLADIVGRFDRLFAEPQMGNGQAAGFFGVVVEIALRVHVGVVADDLDGVLVRADGAVRAEPPEFAGMRARGDRVRIFPDGQGQIRKVIHDADREALLRRAGLHVPVHGDDVARRGVFGAEPVASGVNRDSGELAVDQRGQNIQIKGLADGAGLFGPVEHRDLLYGLRQNVEQIFRDERPVKVNLDKAELFAPCIQVIDDFLGAVAHGAHRDDDLLRVGGAVIVERLVIGADLLVDLVHIIDDDFGNRVVIRIARFTRLEEDVAVLGASAQDRMLRVQRAAAELVHGVPVEHVAEVFIIPDGDFLDFVRSAESVEEMEERHAALDGGKVRDSAQIHHFLRVIGTKHCEAGFPAGINVGLVAKNTKRVGRYRTGRNMDDGGQQLAGHFEHVRDHQEQPL